MGKRLLHTSGSADGSSWSKDSRFQLVILHAWIAVQHAFAGYRSCKEPDYAVRALMAEAAAQAGLAPTRLSFVHAVEVIRVALDDVHLVTTAHPPPLV